MKSIMCLVLFGLIFLSCNDAQRTNSEIESKKLMDVNRQWSRANPEHFFSFLSNDALMMAPDKPNIQGHQQIGKLLTEFQSFPGFKIKWEPQEAFVSSSGDLGYTIDRILVNFNDEDGNNVNLFEKGVTIWKKQDGEWKLAVTSGTLTQRLLQFINRKH